MLLGVLAAACHGSIGYRYGSTTPDYDWEHDGGGYDDGSQSDEACLRDAEADFIMREADRNVGHSSCEPLLARGLLDDRGVAKIVAIKHPSAPERRRRHGWLVGAGAAFAVVVGSYLVLP